MLLLLYSQWYLRARRDTENRMKSNEKQFLVVLVIPLLAATALTLLWVLYYGLENAWIVGQGGTMLVLVGAVLYITFIDSKKRWPNVRPFTRFSRVVTFYRD